MTDQPEQVPAHVQMHVPERVETFYANVMSVWHTPYELTLDFAAIQPAQSVIDGDGNPQTLVPCTVVARIKVPPTVVFAIVRTLNENLTAYEASFGPLADPTRRNEPPLYLPDDMLDTGGPGPAEDEPEGPGEEPGEQP